MYGDNLLLNIHWITSGNTSWPIHVEQTRSASTQTKHKTSLRSSETERVKICYTCGQCYTCAAGIFCDIAFSCTLEQRMKTDSTISNIVSPWVGDVTSLTAESSNTTPTSIIPPLCTSGPENTITASFCYICTFYQIIWDQWNMGCGTFAWTL